MFIVTGGAGFIGSNIIKSLNKRGITDILVIDDLTDGSKFVNLADLQITDYMDKDEFITQIVSGQNFGDIEAILHFGANTSLTENNGKLMMHNNYEYSKNLLHYCVERDIAFIYASDAAVYGDSTITIEERQYEKPLSLYAYTKFQFDQYVRGIWQDAQNNNETLSQIVGLRYTQISNTVDASAFSIDEVCKLNNWLIDNPNISGIFNVGLATIVNLQSLKIIGYAEILQQKSII